MPSRVEIDYSRCTHVNISGARCRMPSANGLDLCVEHEFRRRRESMKPMPPESNKWTKAPLLSYIYMEDCDSIAFNINATLDAMARHSIDERQASTINRLCANMLALLSTRKRIENSVPTSEAIRDVRFDEKGHPHAIDAVKPGADDATTRREPHAASKTPSADATSPSETSAPTPATLSKLQAVAQRDLEFQPARRVSTQEEINLVYATLTPKSKITRLDSHTYVVNTPKSRYRPAQGRSHNPPPNRRAYRTYLIGVSNI